MAIDYQQDNTLLHIAEEIIAIRQGDEAEMLRRRSVWEDQCRALCETRKEIQDWKDLFPATLAEDLTQAPPTMSKKKMKKLKKKQLQQQQKLLQKEQGNKQNESTESKVAVLQVEEEPSKHPESTEQSVV